MIWTDRAEIVSYAEYFNAAQDKAKAIVVYKENLAASLPPASDEKKPDILISPLLKNSRIKKNFAPLESILGRSQVDTSLVYSPLLDFGKSDGKQYLLPLSFNLPAVIFDEAKSPLVSESGTLEFSRLEETSVVFNEKNSSGIYTKMGFAPSWNQEFLYEFVKSRGADIEEKGNAISWNQEKLAQSVESLKNWTAEKNTSTSAEQDFSFKYLYMPVQKQVLSEKCLFAYTTSDKFFSLPQEQISGIDFKWLSNEGKIRIEDDIVMLGVYRKSSNTKNAFDFIIWLFNENTQKNLLERSRNMHLDITTFGICNGFSSLKSVNERILPSYYKNLLGNLPDENAILCPKPLPERWKSLKERVVLPYLSDSTKTDSAVQPKTMEELLSSWRKQFN
ncbi:MAG: hypothetical protein SOT81_00785 [Treponema sp.]|nr:hypothetical protein [Treponema sp.]